MWIEIADGVKGKIQEARRGSREPCGLKCEVDVAERAYQRRGSREPCGLKSMFSVSSYISSCRGSREPCGLKYPSVVNGMTGGYVEARESLVD